MKTRDVLDWIEQCFTSPPTQYRLYGRRFVQVKRPNQQYQSTEGTNSTQTNQTYNKQTWTQNTASPLVYNNMGWLGDSSHRGQGCQAWTAVGLLPRYPHPAQQVCCPLWLIHLVYSIGGGAHSAKCIHKIQLSGFCSYMYLDDQHIITHMYIVNTMSNTSPAVWDQQSLLRTASLSRSKLKLWLHIRALLSKLRPTSTWNAAAPTIQT